ncbi:glycosyltransferase [Goodfellowiella coeruleoviolacea]|uniref:Glycosyltransferase, MGT family n=1 Tax=Goodfellowiella coeruleoviolacea TaxID=334858 RepID=A0AAE3GHV3_9PSEU|nr:glycosyltransferase [Goodfellowiella coeruleoviolacea]MCP2167609.1 glycosyltransferase, MGT family [Goodfellowiella coeruleoviolacea]
MSRAFLFATWSGGGAVPPTLSVARALRERGHGVRVLADRSLHDEVAASGAEPIAWTTAPQGDTTDPATDLLQDFQARTPMGAFARLRDRLVCGPAADFARDTLAELRARPADVLVADFSLLGTLTAGEAAGIPVAALGTTLYPFPTPGAPPFGPGLRPATGAAGRLRDRVLTELTTAPWAKGLPALNAARRAHGLAPVGSVMDAFGRVDRFLVLSPRALDYPSRRFPAHVRHVGPRLDDPAWAGRLELPSGDAPLVLVSLSSTFMGQRAVLERIAAALGTLPVRGLLTTGPAVAPATIRAPGNVLVTAVAPHRAALRHAAVTITHAGHGTAVKSLAEGVPLVCVPLGRDQREVARRVEFAGAGLTVRSSAPPGAIARAVTRVLRDSSYQGAARRLAAAIAAETATDRAVAELEALADGVAGRGDAAEPSGPPRAVSN